VDPVYGDDDLAWKKTTTTSPPFFVISGYNPDKDGGGSFPLPKPRGKPLQKHKSLSTTSHSGLLQHAPYSFKTVQRAIDYINHLAPSTGGKALPWTNADTEATIDYVVIHCLPGLYGPIDTQNNLPRIDSESALPYNGEQFPLKLPPRVSLQGASGLDTIFDARHTATSIIVLDGGTTGPDFLYTMIDGLTIRGARGGHNALNPINSQGAGVLIAGVDPVSGPTISNCFFTDNNVGIAMIWEFDKHTPKIMNNTFVWNQIGIWNGDNRTELPYVGLNTPIVLNNVFDTSTPPGGSTLPAGHVIGISAFEGLDSQDRTVVSRNGVNLPAPIDFNAYELVSLTRTNIGDTQTTIPTVWPRTTTRRGALNQVYAPRVAIQGLTQPPATYGLPSSNRGILWISDIFRRDPSLPWLSRHDFRQAPTAMWISGSTTIQGVGPLMNQGIDFGLNPNGTTSHVGSIILQNGLSLVASPGLPATAETSTTLNSFDQDVDGFGNRRVSDRRYAPKNSMQYPLYGLVDLGADESHEVTVSGYLPSTRIFSRAHSTVVAHTSTLSDNTVPYFLNVAPVSAGQGSTTYIRPQYNFSADIRMTGTVGSVIYSRKPNSEWYAQSNANPYGGTGTGNYTNGVFDTGRTSATNTTRAQWIATSLANAALPRFNQWPHPRNLACDLAPTLYHTVQTEPTNYMTTTWYAWWGERFLDPLLNSQVVQPYAPTYEDIFFPNPWYHSFMPSTIAKRDNRFLYTDRNLPTTVTLSGIVNPPLTIPQGARTNGPNSYLFTDHPTNPTRHGIYLFVFYPAPPGTFTYTVDSYGVAAGEVFAWAANSEWHGVRYNLELLSPSDPQWVTQGVPQNNLQTFLVVQGSTQAAAPLTLSESTGHGSDRTRALFDGSPMQKRVQRARLEFTKKYRSQGK